MDTDEYVLLYTISVYPDVSSSFLSSTSLWLLMKKLYIRLTLYLPNASPFTPAAPPAGHTESLLCVGSPEASMVETRSTEAASEQRYAQNQVRFRIGCA